MRVLLLAVTLAAGTILSGNEAVRCASLWTDTPALSGRPGAQRTLIR